MWQLVLYPGHECLIVSVFERPEEVSWPALEPEVAFLNVCACFPSSRNYFATRACLPSPCAFEIRGIC